MQRSTDRYAGIARWYDPLTKNVLRVPRERLVALCRERGFARVLDIGCGTGVLSRMLHDASMEVACIDASPAMLAFAEKGMGGGAAFIDGGSPLPFAKGAFDAAILALVLHETDEDPVVLLCEALRVAPVCVVLEWRMPERNLDLLARPLVHAIERFAGKQHHARFCNFARMGYLRGIVARANARVVWEEAFKAGTLVVAVVEK